jgi:hypothetical protein
LLANADFASYAPQNRKGRDMPVSKDTPSAGQPLSVDGLSTSTQPEYLWIWVMCLLGVDYFSTLAYQPSITFSVAGRLGPLATVVVVVVTLFGALPVYFYVAGRSAYGQGSIALLERFVRGWAGKTIILFLLGFAATDFVMIKSLSLADAAEHITHNSYIEEQKTLQIMARELRAWGKETVGDTVTAFFTEQIIVTIVLGAVSFLFWWVLRRGFNRNVLFWAVPVVAAYLVLNAIVIGSGLYWLRDHPERLKHWWQQVQAGDWAMDRPFWAGPNWISIALLCFLLLPQLSLGLSGFEMSMILMPQVRGRKDDSAVLPRGRIRNTRKVLLVAAILMSAYLLAATLVTTVLIPESSLSPQGRATNRALAYLAHGGLIADGPQGHTASLSPLFGVVFGSVYDITTVLLLTLAGTSVMTALSVLLPQFLLRFGMELKWTARWGVLLMLFALVNLAITLYFRASVEDQRGAYATGVLAVMSSACLVTVLSRHHDLQKKGSRRRPWYFILVAVIFLLTTLAVIVTSPTGLLIAFGFIVAILTMSVVIRAVRSDEMRTTGFDFVDAQSEFLWNTLRVLDFPVLVPHRPGLVDRAKKEAMIRHDHNLDPNVEVVLLEIEVDDPSNFYQRLLIEINQEQMRYTIYVRRCVSIAHAIAAIALEMSRESKPPALHFGWSDMNLMASSWSYLAFGEGNISSKVRELIQLAVPEPNKRPRVIVG